MALYELSDDDAANVLIGISCAVGEDAIDLDEHDRVAKAISDPVKPDPNGGVYVCRECRSQLGAPHKLDCSQGGKTR